MNEMSIGATTPPDTAASAERARLSFDLDVDI
jgi:hypothetical protein